VDTNRQLYDSKLQRVKETGVAAAMRASGIRVIDPAIPPGAPYKPNLNRSIVRGCAGGLFLGVILVFLRERADRSLQQPGDAAFYLNVPELGVIPSAGADRRKRLRARQAGGPNLLGDGAPRMDQDRVELITWTRKPSMLSEAFRTTLTSFLFSGRNGDRPRVVVLTSANPAEGKTTVAVNLAIALAEISQRVLAGPRDPRAGSGTGPGGAAAGEGADRRPDGVAEGAGRDDTSGQGELRVAEMLNSYPRCGVCGHGFTRRACHLLLHQLKSATPSLRPA
jgi:hypothetical protein